MNRSAPRLLLAALALTLVGTACVGRGRGEADGELHAARVVGDVTMQVPGADARPLREGDDVPAGASLRTGRGADVRLESGGRAIELGEETQATLLSAGRMTLELGRALIEVPGARTLSLDSRGVSVRVTGGAARLERGLGALRVSVYAGAARVEILGRGVDVPRLREFVVAGGIPIQRDPRPLDLSNPDAWDRRLLADVLKLDNDLAQFGRGFNAEFRGEAVVPAFFAPFVGIPSLGFIASRLRTAEPADILIGLVFAQRLAARQGNVGRVGTLFAELRALRDQGATWGLIAKERGLDLPPLFRAVLDAIRRGTAPAPPASSSSGGGGGGSTPEPTSSPRPSASPRPRPSGSPSPSPSPSPTPTCSTLDQLLGNCTDASGSTGSESSETGGDTVSGCSILGVLLDPAC